MEQLRLGPVGGEGGRPFDDYTIPDGARLSAVHIYTEWVIDALQLAYVDAGGAPVTRPPAGGLGGTHHVFYLDEDEYLTGLSGRCGWYIDAVRVHTNKRESPLFGGSGGDRDFDLHAPPGYEVVGLFGRSDWYIDALGVVARPLDVRRELAEGAALLAEAAAEQTATEAEEALDEVLAGIPTADRQPPTADGRKKGNGRRRRATGPLNADQLTTAPLTSAPPDDVLMAELAEEREAEARAEADEEVLDWATMGVAAALTSGDEDESGAWQPNDDGEPIAAQVVVRRASVRDEAALDELEDAAVAEAIAALRDGREGEGVVDVTVYSQVIPGERGKDDVATVLAVAGESLPDAAGGEESGAAVMVTDEIESDDDLLALEEEAVQGALVALEDDLGHPLEDADVTIYTGLTTGDIGQTYAAIVAIATPSAAQVAADQGDAPQPEDAVPPGEPAELVARAPVVQLSGVEARPQDLQLIEGIGPKIAALLIEHGINDLGQLALTPPERIRAILGGAGKRFRLAVPDSWPQQAALAAAGNWAALTEMQTRLRGGK